MRHVGTRRPLLLGIAFLLAGCALLAYPPVRHGLYREQAAQVIAAYEEERAALLADRQQADALYEAITQYNRALFEDRQSGLTGPHAYEQPDFSLRAHGFSQEMIGYLDIPKMEVLLPVYLGASQENMARGAAHMSRTSIPVGGESTKAVIAAHRDLSTAVMLRDIELLEPGDEVLFTNFRETLFYRVCTIRIIRPDEVEQVLIEEDRDLLTLLTCHPYRSDSQRYLVHCERVLEGEAR